MRTAAALTVLLAACAAPKAAPAPDTNLDHLTLRQERTWPTTTTTQAVRVRSQSKPRARTLNSAPANPSVVEVLACIRAIESGGNYQAVSPTGKYQGAYQFSAETWSGAVSRAGYPEWADDRLAPSHVQDAAAAQLYSERGLQPWPVPARRCA